MSQYSYLTEFDNAANFSIQYLTEISIQEIQIFTLNQHAINTENFIEKIIHILENLQSKEDMKTLKGD